MNVYVAHLLEISAAPEFTSAASHRRHNVRYAFCLAELSAGRSMAARIAMIAMTTHYPDFNVELVKSR